jgi:hypothetical protein
VQEFVVEAVRRVEVDMKKCQVTKDFNPSEGSWNNKEAH